ncbi:unnamed protein product [Cylicocyclus nassatus]|uniref:Uncharacterized protein n=1 Tax=Cylicocyclus nassatus TaxID=53992 RepID=A0AA36HHU5_CYLNA|nr:unnamed protein product [Cylicocyclus nassatus]
MDSSSDEASSHPRENILDDGDTYWNEEFFPELVQMWVRNSDFEAGAQNNSSFESSDEDPEQSTTELSDEELNSSTALDEQAESDRSIVVDEEARHNRSIVHDEEGSNSTIVVEDTITNHSVVHDEEARNEGNIVLGEDARTDEEEESYSSDGYSEDDERAKSSAAVPNADSERSIFLQLLKTYSAFRNATSANNESVTILEKSSTTGVGNALDSERSLLSPSRETSPSDSNTSFAGCEPVTVPVSESSAADPDEAGVPGSLHLTRAREASSSISNVSGDNESGVVPGESSFAESREKLDSPLLHSQPMENFPQTSRTTSANNEGDLSSTMVLRNEILRCLDNLTTLLTNVVESLGADNENAVKDAQSHLPQSQEDSSLFNTAISADNELIINGEPMKREVDDPGYRYAQYLSEMTNRTRDIPFEDWLEITSDAGVAVYDRDRYHYVDGKC